MSKRSKRRKCDKRARRMTYRQVFRIAIYKATGHSGKMVDDFLEPLVRSTPDFRSVNLDSPAPKGLLKDMLSRPMDVLAWLVAGRIALETGSPNGVVEGELCLTTGKLTVDHVRGI